MTVMDGTLYRAPHYWDLPLCHHYTAQCWLRSRKPSLRDSRYLHPPASGTMIEEDRVDRITDIFNNRPSMSKRKCTTLCYFQPDTHSSAPNPPLRSLRIAVDVHSLSVSPSPPLSSRETRTQQVNHAHTPTMKEEGGQQSKHHPSSERGPCRKSEYA